MEWVTSGPVHAVLALALLSVILWACGRLGGLVLDFAGLGGFRSRVRRETAHVNLLKAAVIAATSASSQVVAK